MAKETNASEAARDYYLADFERVAADNGQKGSNWLREVRSRAMEHFGATGFPFARDERWRFTNFSKLLEKHFVLGDGGQGSALKLDAIRNSVGWLGQSRVVFVNGKFSSELSSMPTFSNGVFAGRIAAAVREGVPQLEQNLSRVDWPTESPFAALNTAFLTDGCVLCIPDGVACGEPIQFLYLTTDDNTDAVTHPRNLIVLGKGAEANVVESYVGLGDFDYWTNAVTEISLGDGARLNAFRSQLEGCQSHHTATTHTRHCQDSKCTATTIELGSLLSRHDIRVRLEGTGAECALFGLSHLEGRQHVDQHTTIDHAQPHCSSRESFNGVFDGRSQGVFTGRILVRPGAQKTDAMQASRNLLLSETAHVDTQPQLEIFADDVKCTHGATVGPIDDEAMFYLQSKGLTAGAARAMLTYGFGSEILNTIWVDELRKSMDVIFRSRLERAN